MNQTQEIVEYERQSLVKQEDFEINMEQINRMKQAYEMLKQFTYDLLEEGIDKDFGTIPGTPKPTLFQPGAISLAIAYNLYADPPEIISETFNHDSSPPFIEYKVRQTMRSKRTGGIVSSFIGSCNSWEEKYRFRSIPEWKLSDDLRKIKDTLKKEKRNKKDGGVFYVYVIPNANVYDQLNTILQMAEKRAYVGAVRKAVPGATKLFTQDLEDMNLTGDNDDDTKSDPKPKVDTTVLAQIQELRSELGIDKDGLKEIARQQGWGDDFRDTEVQKKALEYLQELKAKQSPPPPASTAPQGAEPLRDDSAPSPADDDPYGQIPAIIDLWSKLEWTEKEIRAYMDKHDFKTYDPLNLTQQQRVVVIGDLSRKVKGK